MANDLSETHILIVDNPSEVRNLREALRDEVFKKVSDMNSGLTVLTEIKKNRPAVMLVNQNLPKYSGLQVFKSISADKGLASIKFIMTTPKLNRREREELEKEGVPIILERPFGSETLRETIFGLFGMSGDARKMVAEEAYNEGMALFEKGDFETALTKFREASDNDPQPRSSFMQGRCYLELGMHDQSVAALQTALRLDPRFPEVDLYMGMAQQRKADYQASIKNLERAAARGGADARTHVELGKSYLGADRVEDADRAFGTATAMEPENVAHRTEIGNAYLDKGLYEKAENAFGEALDINPENIPLYNRMAIALRKQAKYGDAIAIYTKALRIAPADEGLYYNVARALHESGDRAKAIKALDKALSLDPEFDEARTLRDEYRSAAS